MYIEVIFVLFKKNNQIGQSKKINRLGLKKSAMTKTNEKDKNLSVTHKV